MKFEIHLQVSMVGADAGRAAQWIGEAVSNTDIVDSDMQVVIHTIAVEEES